MQAVLQSLAQHYLHWQRRERWRRLAAGRAVCCWSCAGGGAQRRDGGRRPWPQIAQHGGLHSAGGLKAGVAHAADCIGPGVDITVVSCTYIACMQSCWMSIACMQQDVKTPDAASRKRQSEVVAPGLAADGLGAAALEVLEASGLCGLAVNGALNGALSAAAPKVVQRRLQAGGAAG